MNCNYFDYLKDKLETELGRNVDCTYEDMGELEDLLQIAKKYKDNYVIELIKELLGEYK